MFTNIGGKIKGLAKVVCWIGIILSFIMGVIMMATQGELGVATGLITMIIGALASWVGSFVLYGFGELVENSDIRTELAVKKSMESESKEPEA